MQSSKPQKISEQLNVKKIKEAADAWINGEENPKLEYDAIREAKDNATIDTALYLLLFLEKKGVNFLQHQETMEAFMEIIDRFQMITYQFLTAQMRLFIADSAEIDNLTTHELLHRIIAGYAFGYDRRNMGKGQVSEIEAHAIQVASELGLSQRKAERVFKRSRDTIYRHQR